MDLKAWFAPTANHRTVYQPVLRDRVPDDWSMFDFPVPELVSGRRGITTVPTQALFMMNSGFIVEQSQKTAARILEKAQRPEESIREAYLAILNRRPSEEEQQEAAAFLPSLSISTKPGDALAALCQALFASAEFRNLH
jgi:hypothetical protein